LGQAATPALNSFLVEFDRILDRLKGTDGFIRASNTDSVEDDLNQLSLSILSSSVDNFLAFVSDLLHHVFISRPEMLQRRSASVAISDVLAHRNMGDFTQWYAEKLVSELAFMGFQKLNDELSKKIGFKLVQEVSELTKLTFLIEVRNLYVHNRARINSIFKSRIPSYKNAPIGSYLTISSGKDFIPSLLFLRSKAEDIDEAAIAKFKLPVLPALRSRYFEPVE
jgi:hypothetical protein